MIAVLVIAMAATAVWLAVRTLRTLRARRRGTPEDLRESTPALESFLVDALEQELAGALGLRNATAEERRPLARTLRGEPDPELVTRIEAKVDRVELGYLRYAHESDVEVTVRVLYENGEVSETSRRLAGADVPDAIRTDLDRLGATRIFRTWVFPWQRVTTL